jgi:hypothetical protein
MKEPKMADKPKPKEQHIHVHVHGAAKSSSSKPKQAGIGGTKAEAVGKPGMNPLHELRELQREHYIQGYMRGKALREKHIKMGLIPTRNGPKLPPPRSAGRVGGLGPRPHVSQGGMVEMPGHYAYGGDSSPPPDQGAPLPDQGDFGGSSGASNPGLDAGDMTDARKKAQLVAKATAFAAQLPGATQPKPLGYAGGGLTPAQMHVMGRGAATDATRSPGAHLIHSNVPGRVDRIPMKARTGSYVLPADVVSGLGQGNTTAGAKMWGEALSHGAGNIKPARASFPRAPAAPKLMAPVKPSIPKPVTSFGGAGKSMFADGGETAAMETGETDDGYTPIITAGGEMVIDPEVVEALGGGDAEAGKEMLNKSVLHVRKQIAAHNKKLPGPVE